MSEGYVMNFNQDFTSISVLGKSGFRLFTISASDKVDEIFAKENTEHIRIVERLFSSSLVVLVTEQKPKCLKMLHFKKQQDICNCVYPSDILNVRMNRSRLVVRLLESIHIHDIRDMRILHSIESIPPNTYGLCSLSLNSYLAFPISTSTGNLQIFDSHKQVPKLIIKAHNTPLSALNFSPNGTLLATASERGTVIRVFCVNNGQRVQEFRRGIKRCVRIASLEFSVKGEFLCASSNTATVHIFKIDTKAAEAAESKCNIFKPDTEPKKETTISNAKGDTDNKIVPTSANKLETLSDNSCNNQEPACTTSNDSWSMSDYLSKAVSSYLIPAQIGDVLAQDRAFATAVLRQPGLKHVCGLVRMQKELWLLMACEDGFLYVYDFNSEVGGVCKLLHVHDLRYSLEGVVELKLTESMEKMTMLPSKHAGNPTADSSPNNNTTISVDSCPSSHIIIENPEPSVDNSYAGILKGPDQTVKSALTDSVKYRKLCDAIDTPTKLYDELQFPPVAIAAKD